MTIKELNEINETFQKKAVQLSELIPSGSLTNVTSLIIRNGRKMQSYFEKLTYCDTETQFIKTIDKVEHYLDELVFILDQLDIANKKQKISLIGDFVKNGYELLSLYSMCVDQVIKERIPTEE